MADNWEIGKEARELDNKSMKERMKIEGRSIKKIVIALIFYSLTMIIFCFCL